MSRWIVKILLLLYMFSSYVSAIHIHTAHDVHVEECKVCMVAKVFESTDLNGYSIDMAPLDVPPLLAELSHSCIVVIPLKGYHSTAPPLFTHI